MKKDLNSIPIFIGCDYRERAATNVLIDSLYQKSKFPLSITPLITEQLKNKGIFWRKRDPKQSTDFSFTRFLVPYLMNYKDWAIFMDCDMLCRADISEIINLLDEKFSLFCVKHNHNPKETIKFQGEIQSSYPKKNWSSFMIFNCKKCKRLTLDYVNNASGLDLHRFNWLEGDHLIGGIENGWNYLIQKENINTPNNEIKMLHWTLGGPWFKEQRLMGEVYSAEWFAARDDSFKLWD